MTNDKVTESNFCIHYPTTGDLWVNHLKCLMHFSPHILATCTALFIFLSFNAIIVWESTNSEALYYTLSSSLLFLPPSWFQIFPLSILFSDTLSQCSSPNTERPCLRHPQSVFSPNTERQCSLLTLRDHVSDTLSQCSLLTLRDHVSDTLNQCSLLTLRDSVLS